MQLIGKNQNHWNCSYVDKKWCADSDTLWIIVSQLSWHVVHSPNILTSYLKIHRWAMDVENMQEQTASIVQVTMQYMKKWALFPLL